MSWSKRKKILGGTLSGTTSLTSPYYPLKLYNILILFIILIGKVGGR